jgi:eukaryotic translation initiation factor 2C
VQLGGYNSPLGPEMTTFLGTSTVIFGMDVSHGSPGDVDSPSVAAVVASKDWPKVSGLYSARVRTQPSKMEMIEGLYEEVDGQRGGMVKELLVDFYKSYTGPAIQRKPQQIIVYRDGVSESQFDQCLDLEVTAFLKACEALESGYHPKITFIVAQKRHNTRFFPVPNSPCMNNGNVLPGKLQGKALSRLLYNRPPNGKCQNPDF